MKNRGKNKEERKQDNKKERKILLMAIKIINDIKIIIQTHI